MRIFRNSGSSDERTCSTDGNSRSRSYLSSFGCRGTTGIEANSIT
jgi:hypothetical protein